MCIRDSDQAEQLLITRSRKYVARIQERKLEDASIADQLAPNLLDELAGCSGGTTRGDEVVDDQDTVCLLYTSRCV